MHRRLFLTAVVVLCAGCHCLPHCARQPAVYNPFPQLSKVAVAPFLNLSSNASVDGRQFAQAYFNELQSVPGYEVLPVGVVELAMRQHGVGLSSPADAQRLAQLLDVDAVVVGAVTDFNAYYPPRCAMQIEWYAADPSFQPIPPGYGLPWGTPAELDIPEPLVFEAEMALARAKLQASQPMPPPADALLSPAAQPQESVHPASATVTVESSATTATSAADATPGTSPPPELVPLAAPPALEPVLRHTKVYNGHDPQVTAALETYVRFRCDARFGGWPSYLQRSDDFIRFCCHMHISEMLTARGGAGRTRVVWQWPADR